VIDRIPDYESDRPPEQHSLNSKKLLKKFTSALAEK